MIESDIEVPAVLSSVQVVMRSETGKLYGQHSFELVDALHPSAGVYTLPLSFGVVPIEGDAQRVVLLEIEGSGRAGVIAQRRIVLRRLVPGSTRLLPVFLSKSCTSLMCPSAQTCIDGRCTSEVIDVGRLRAIEPGGELAFSTPRTAPSADGGVAPPVTRPDATLPIDTGTPPDLDRPDASIVDSGDPPVNPTCTAGLTEASTCDPDNVLCCTSPEVVCRRDETSPTGGLCVKTCDATANEPGTMVNSTCNGVGRQCADFYGLGPHSGACKNVVPDFGEFDETRLATCDPRFNARAFAGELGDRICVPLCTSKLSDTRPRPMTCRGAAQVCTGPVINRDADGNEFKACTVPVPRSERCGTLLGASCRGTEDQCVLGTCQQTFGTSCPVVTPCADSDERCVEATDGDGTLAVCLQACELYSAGDCGPDGACRPISVGRGGRGGQRLACRARDAHLGQGGDCSDAVGFGTRRYTCDESTMCIQSATHGFEDAMCHQLCDPLRPERAPCPGASSCVSFGGSFTYGFCL